MPNLEQRNKELNKKIANSNLGEAVATLVKDSKKRKRQVRILAISIILDIILTIGLAYISIRTQHIANQSESNHQALIQSCMTSNDARANNKQLWHYLLTLPLPNVPTLQQQQVRNQLSTFIDKTFAPRDCNNMSEN